MVIKMMYAHQQQDRTATRILRSFIPNLNTWINNISTKIAIQILHGMRERYEIHHKLRNTFSALVSAANRLHQIPKESRELEATRTDH
ncbi:hypothetical protein Bca4012_064121 [Brassica carinata]